MNSPTLKPRRGLSTPVIVGISVLVVGVAGLLLIGILFGFLSPTLQQARIEALKLQCADNLQALAELSTKIASASPKARYPRSPEGSLATFELLLQKGNALQGSPVDPELLVCPLTDHVPSEIGAPLTEKNCSYEAVPWDVDPTDPDAMLYYNREPFPGVEGGGTRNVVFTNFTVRCLTEDEFQGLLQQQRVENTELEVDPGGPAG